MRFGDPLVRARFIRREKRFLIHAVLEDGQPVIAHTNNTGRMTGCLVPGGEIWLSPARGPRRKLAWTLEIAESASGVLGGVNTQRANGLVAEGLMAGLLPDIRSGALVKAEQPYPGGGSRVDFLVDDHIWIEVKNVTLVENRRAIFPDAPTARGRKHLLDLAGRVAAGDRALLVFCVQRPDADSAGCADAIDPDYGHLLREVVDRGVEVAALQVTVTPEALIPARLLPILLDPI